MRLDQILFSQGFGTRRVCAGLIELGDVAIGGQVIDDPRADIPTAGLVLQVQGRPWPYHQHALVMLHKPAGYECSQKPKHHPSVLSLLPPPLRARGLQPIGRLDEDTTGLLLLTDHGALIHRLTSPKHHVPKVYEVTAKHPVSDEQLARLCSGVMLDDEPLPVCAAATRRLGENRFAMTLHEGKYHQVKRMVAAIENRCEALHRASFGALLLPDDLAPGQWRWVDAASAIVMARDPAADAPAA